MCKFHLGLEKTNEGYGNIKVPDEYLLPDDDWQPPSNTEQILIKPEPSNIVKPYGLLTGIAYIFP